MFTSIRKAFVIAAMITALAVSSFAQSNKTTWVDPANCSGTAATLAITANGQVRAAAGNGAIRFFTTDNAGGTLTINCDLTSAFAARIGSAARITSVSFYYGIQTNAITSIAAPVVSFVKLATSGAAAAGVVSTAGGSLTVTPASLQVTVTTTGACFNERVSFGTPIAPQDGRRVTFEQVMTVPASISTVQICGIQVNYIDVP